MYMLIAIVLFAAAVLLILASPSAAIVLGVLAFVAGGRSVTTTGDPEAFIGIAIVVVGSIIAMATVLSLYDTLAGWLFG